MNLGSEDKVDELVEQVVTELIATVRLVSHQSLVQGLTLIDKAPRIFVTGAGRSGLCMRALAMRLMHLGKMAYVVGETTTTSISADDLLIIGSGSGRTASLLTIAGQAQSQGAKILLFTTDGASPLAEMADHQLLVPAPSLKSADHDRLASVQPMGTLFEQSLMVICDCLILGLMQRLGTDTNQMRQRHANLE